MFTPEERRQPHAASERARRARLGEKYREAERARYADRKERVSAHGKLYYLANKERIKAAAVEYYASNREARRAYRAAHYEKNRDLIAERNKTTEACKRRRAREKMRYKTDPEYRLTKNLRSAFLQALLLHGDGKKTQSVNSLIGCTIAELVAHLESQFTGAMSWQTYGSDGWHIDHRKPCAKFDLTDPEQQRSCFHFTNLRPLWSWDNQSKGAT